jgi:hypothetical protein
MFLKNIEFMANIYDKLDALLGTLCKKNREDWGINKSYFG